MADFEPQEVKGPSKNPTQENIITPAEPSEFSLPVSRASRIKQFYSDNKWYVWAIIAGLLIIAGLAVYAFYPRKVERTQEAKVQIDISSPETVATGGEVVYKIRVQNNDSAKLTDMHLELVYDTGMSYVTSSPKSENLSGTQFNVPDLSSGQNAVVIVKTLAQGNVNDQKRLVVRLNYRFENFNSPFVTEQSSTVRLIAADVNLDINGPDKVNNGDTVKYDIFYRNNSKKDIDNARIQLTYPEGFSFDSSTPQPSLGNNIWNVGSIKSQTSGKISLQGVFKGAKAGQKSDFKAEFLVIDDSGNFYTQSSVTNEIEIQDQPLVVEQKFIDNNGGIVKPGDSVTVEISFRNNTSIANTGVQLVAQIDSNSVVASSIQAESAYVQDKTITWNGSSLGILESLNSADEGKVRYTFTVANPASKLDTNITISNKIKIKSNQNTTFINGSPISVKVSSPSTMSGKAEYSSGQNPPQVGKSSSYKVALSLTNSSNDYREGVVIAYVPVGVTLDAATISNQEKNLVKYDSSTGKLVWSLGKLSAYSGVGQSPRTLTFNVKFTPGSNQVGKEVVLLKTITFTAKDDFTDQNINLDTQDLSSDTGNGNGRVIQ